MCEWREVFEQPGVPDRDCALLSTALRRAAEMGMRELEHHL
ncbi:hypothetical protein [Xanthomonas graminis]|nr:hypothetical protein [Xanthomonas translucens]